MPLSPSPSCSRLGVFGYPGAVKIPLGNNCMATPEHFFATLGATSAACRHEPQQDLTVRYGLPTPRQRSLVFPIRVDLVTATSPLRHSRH
jgi:hypothetical protein